MSNRTGVRTYFRALTGTFGFVAACAVTCAFAGFFGFPRIAHANIIGADMQNFNTATNGLDFVTVHSSETLNPGIFNFGLFLNYAVNTLPYQEANQSQNRVGFNDSLLAADFNVGLGLADNWDAGISFPQVLSQSVDASSGARGQFASTGLTEIRMNTKYRFLGNDSGGAAVIASLNWNQTINNPFTGQGAGPTMNLEAAVDRSFGAYTVGGNVGYRFRDPGTPVAGIGIQPFQDQIIASTAVNYMVKEWDTKFIAEVYGAMPAESTDFHTDRKQSSLEALLGAKYDVNPNLAAHAGGATELMHGNASPDWRVYVGLNYTFGPIFGSEPKLQKRHPIQPVGSRVQLKEDPFASAPRAPVETFIARDVLFEFNSDEIEESSKEALDGLAVYLMKPPVFKQMDISGHTDSIGNAVYNLDLSQRRARRVKRYLVERHNLPEDRIGAYGYGEGVPIADNGNYQGRRLNRRVEFKITREFSTTTSKQAPVSNVSIENTDPAPKTKKTKKKSRKKN